ncbi:MAG: DNA-directed polymerase [Actinomycetia bacterium]|nr:DNA-directed polymerase [Actinomycetes bacterium]
MRFQVGREVLAEAVAWVARTLPARPAVPVLAGMVLETGTDLTLSSFDYEVSGRAAVEVDEAEPGRVLVPGRLLAEIVRSLPAQPVHFETTGSEAVLTCGSAEFGLQLMPVEDYPTPPGLPSVAGLVDSGALAAAIGRVVVAASRDDTLPMLTGVRVDIEGDLIRLACTDRYRIAASELTWKPSQPDFAAAVVVPARTLADTAKSLRAGTETELALTGAGDTLIGLSNAGRTTTARLLDDQFIDYRARLSADWAIHADVPVGPFIDVIKRVALVAERSTPLRLAFSQGEVRVRAATGDSARANEALPAELDGPDIDVAFNAQYLLDGLAGVGTGTARISFVTPAKPSLITGLGGDDYRYLLMPIRLSG